MSERTLIQQAIEDLRSTADALERCIDEVPEGFGLQRKDKLSTLWVKSDATTSGTMNIVYYHYRLVPLETKQ